MAKKVFPGAAFEPCDNEVVPFWFDLFTQISLLAPLPARAKEILEKCPGAMRLRRFQKNDVICRQGEEDCTAFYILKTDDLDTLFQYPQKRIAQAPIEKAAALKKIAELETAAAKALDESKSKDAEKAQKQVKDLQEKVAQLEREIELLPALKAKLDALADSGRPKRQADLQIGAQADLELAQLEEQALAADNKQEATFFRRLRTADPTRKRASADESGADPDLSRRLHASATAAELRTAAFVYLGETPSSPPEPGWFGWLKRAFGGAPSAQDEPAPVNLPFDGPTEVSARTRQATLYEGELFGEMACLNRAPRSATVVAARECYILEMLSNILMEIDKDPGYQKERRRVYEERVLDLQMRGLSIFADLTDEQFARALLEVRAHLKLRSCKSGEIICDEHERSDCVYLVRSGMVQVKKNVSSLLSVADIASWKDTVTALRADGPAAAWRKLMPTAARNLLESRADPEQIPAGDQAEIVHGINEVIKNAQVPAAAEFKDIIARANLSERVRSYTTYQAPRQFDARELEEVIKSASVRVTKQAEPAKADDWSELDGRRLNRLLLEEIVPQGFRRLPRASGPDTTLTYLSRGEFIGEIGVCKKQPRSSTCIAFGQPRFGKEDLGEIELVQIPGEVFLQLMDAYPVIKARVDAEIAFREKRSTEHAQRIRPGAVARTTQESDRLGLMQGQKLMLIDMERCTLCLECVKGCVDAHDDGRSRLFLTGHRYDKYLVPITCRSCLDPVCMIGCPVRSIQRGDNREIIIKDWCVGCQKCAKQCPYDAIKMHDVPKSPDVFRIRDEIAVVCDLCSSLPDQTPRCVYACPHDAATRVNARLELPVL